MNRYRCHVMVSEGNNSAFIVLQGSEFHSEFLIRHNHKGKT